MQATLLSWALALLHSWQRLQVTYYGGKYSMQRVLALEAYTTTTSVSCVVVVCVGSIMPMLSLSRADSSPSSERSLARKLWLLDSSYSSGLRGSLRSDSSSNILN
ncbi:hypothetical protein GQ600_19677 [Phytophthora cactorum]|nr:hypothetical protein GQ600_19677 [Phytophthora cactorum]